MRSSITNIFLLPNEITSIILSFIPPREVFKCEMVSVLFLSEMKNLIVWKTYQETYGFDINRSQFDNPYQLLKSIFQSCYSRCLICNHDVISDYVMIIAGCLLETNLCLFCDKKKASIASCCQCRKYPICHPNCIKIYKTVKKPITRYSKVSIYKCPLCSKNSMGIYGIFYF